MDQKRADSAAKSRPMGREPNTTYELFIGILAVYSLLVAGLIFLLPPYSPSRQILLVADTLTCFIFLADFIRSLSRAPSKRAYLKWGWLDLVGSIPGILILRLARLHRLSRAVAVLRQQKYRKVFHRLSQRLAESAISGTGLVVILALTFGSLFILQVERQDPESNIRTSADALWWSIVTMSTVGYGDHFPVTQGGRLMAILLITVGVAIFGVLTSYLATIFMAPYQKEKEPSDDIMSLKDDMAALQAKLEAIERLLKDR